MSFTPARQLRAAENGTRSERETYALLGAVLHRHLDDLVRVLLQFCVRLVDGFACGTRITQPVSDSNTKMKLTKMKNKAKKNG